MRTNSLGTSPEQGNQIASIAGQVVARLGKYYARDEAPPSPYAGLSGNSHPGQTRLTWLKGLYKCNQFIGDVLTMAGFRMPTWRMPDGSEHYVNAEMLLKRPAEFARVTALEDIRAGDILLVDWSEPGENGAHLEIVSSVDIAAQRLLTLGAHKQGATMMDFSWIFRGAVYDQARQGWINYSPTRGNYAVYVLRAAAAR